MMFDLRSPHVFKDDIENELRSMEIVREVPVSLLHSRDWHGENGANLSSTLLISFLEEHLGLRQILPAADIRLYDGNILSFNNG